MKIKRTMKCFLTYQIGKTQSLKTSSVSNYMEICTGVCANVGNLIWKIVWLPLLSSKCAYTLTL